MSKSIINSILLSPLIHLNNLEKQKIDVNPIELSHSTLSSAVTPIEDDSDEYTLTNSLILINSHSHSSYSVDSLLVQRSAGVQDSNISMNDNPDNECTWDHQYDSRLNHSLISNESQVKEIDLSSNPATKDIQNCLLDSDTNTCEQTILNDSSSFWQQMKHYQCAITDMDIGDTRSVSTFNLYRIFQQKADMLMSASFRHSLQLYQQQRDFIILNYINKTLTSKSNVDQAIQTSVSNDPPLCSKATTDLRSYSVDDLSQSVPISPLNVNKSLPDLSFVSKYANELHRSRAASPLLCVSTNISRATPSPILTQQYKYDFERPRTLKSIKRHKNSKQSGEPLTVFSSPQLRKIFAVALKESNQSLKIIDMKLPSPSIPALISNTNFDSHSPKSHYSSMADLLNAANQLHLSHQHHSEYDLSSSNGESHNTKRSISFSERIAERTEPSNDNTEQRVIRRRQTDIIHVDSVLDRRRSLTDSPPNEFCLQNDEERKILMEKSHVNVISNADESIANRTVSKSIFIDDVVERIIDIIKHLFEIKRSDKSFFLNNENNPQLDHLLQNDLCSIILTILEHGRKQLKKVTLWKIIESILSSTNLSSVSPRQVPAVYLEAKQIAQNISLNWLYRFQAFIFILLNKNELINWLYYFTRQKDIIQHYYQSPDALILVSLSSTFNLFERIMTQLEKLTTLSFQLTYHVPNDFTTSEDQFGALAIDAHSNKSTARNWLTSISKKNSKNLTQSIVGTSTHDSYSNNSITTVRSTLVKKFNSFFTRTSAQHPRKPTNVTNTKSLDSTEQILSPEQSRRRYLSKFFPSSPAAVPNNKLMILADHSVKPSMSSTEASSPILKTDTPTLSPCQATVPLSE